MYKFKSMLLVACLLLIAVGLGTMGCGSSQGRSGSWDTTRTVETYHAQSSSGDWLWYYVIFSNGRYSSYSSPTQITNYNSVPASSWAVSDTRPEVVSGLTPESTAVVNESQLPQSVQAEIQAEIQAEEPATTEGNTSEEPSSGNSDEGSSGSTGGESSGGDAGGGGDSGGGGGD